MVDEKTSAQQFAEKACAQIDASRVRVQSTRQRNKKCGNLEGGAWRLPEGDDAKKTVSLLVRATCPWGRPTRTYRGVSGPATARL